jgi:[acyl-carrier-protein] S-malonyltransferase
MKEALAGADLRPSIVPVYANVTAAPAGDPAEIRALLVDQVTGMVRWRESVTAMFEAGVTHLVEWGGKVLTPMVKRIAPDATATSVVTMDDIESLVKEI